MWRKNGGFRGAHTCWFFPPHNPRQRQLCFRPLTKSQTDWWPLSWNGRDDFCLSSAVTACPGVWNRASQDLLLMTAQFIASHLEEYLFLFLTTVRLQVIKPGLSPMMYPGICLHLLAWHSVFSQCSSKTPRIFPSVCLFFLVFHQCVEGHWTFKAS